jgi:hypothetical protein
MMWHCRHRDDRRCVVNIPKNRRVVRRKTMSGSSHSSGSFWRRIFSNKTFPPTLWVPIVIALISFWYANIDAGRRERLEHVRSQIANLYGPLYSLIRTQKHLWEDLGKNNPTDLAFLAEVALPLNKKIEETALKSGEVIRCPRIVKDLHQFFDFAESAVLAAQPYLHESAKSSARSVQLAAVKPTTDPKNNLKSYPRHFAAHVCKELTVLKDWETRLNHPLKGLLFLPTVDDPYCEQVSAMPEDAKDTCDVEEATD